MLTSPLAGTLLSWSVEDGSRVEQGQTVAVVEAMEVETAVAAHRSGRLQRTATIGAWCPVGTELARVLA